MVKHIIQKRNDKTLTIEQYKTQLETKKINKKQKVSMKYTVDISKRHKFKRVKNKVLQIDINLAHKIEEIKVLPDSFLKDQIGSFFFR